MAAMKDAPPSREFSSYGVIVIRDVPTHTSSKAIEDYCSSLSSARDIRRTAISDKRQCTTYDLLVQFPTMIYALRYLRTFPKGRIILDGQNLLIESKSVGARFPETVSIVKHHSDQSLPRTSRGSPVNTASTEIDFSLLPRRCCHVCFNDVSADDGFITPCFKCQQIFCLRCLKGIFEHALQDRERMPIACCYRTVHPAVFREIIPDAECKVYERRYDEMRTQDPLYCPVATCSEFIRDKDSDIGNRQIYCPKCKATICPDCRQLSCSGHTCDSDKTEEEKICEKFGYKKCLHCRQVTTRLWGCDHVRCACGAQWCWLCGFSVVNCTCQDDDVPDLTFSDPVGSDPDTRNLDDPNEADVMARAVNLGAEPDYRLDFMSCKHSFQVLTDSLIPRYWSKPWSTVIDHNVESRKNDPARFKLSEEAWESPIDCLTCHNQAKIVSQKLCDTLGKAATTPNGKCDQCGPLIDQLAYLCGKCGIICCRKCGFA